MIRFCKQLIAENLPAALSLLVLMIFLAMALGTEIYGAICEYSNTAPI